MTDDDLAEQWAHIAPSTKREERFSGWSPIVAKIADLIDAVNAQTVLVARVNGNSNVRIPPVLRPVGAIERARLRRQRQQHRDFMAKFKFSD